MQDNRPRPNGRLSPQAIKKIEETINVNFSKVMKENEQTKQRVVKAIVVSTIKEIEEGRKRRIYRKVRQKVVMLGEHLLANAITYLIVLPTVYFLAKFF